jgi:flavin reductase (DIM6/NTAB) family NADH-FMN oxidoreductase RutF
VSVTPSLSRLVAPLDPALVVVTTVAGEERAGCLVGFHAQCSITPARYVVWLSKANHTCRVGMRASMFAVHLLDRSQRDLAELFGGHSGDELDKFSRCEWTSGPGGVPLLDACPNRFAAARMALLDEGSDHVCVVLEPVAVEGDGRYQPLRLSRADDIEPGHAAEERPRPPTERAR